MTKNVDLICLNPENIEKYGCACFMNQKEEGHQKKLAWVKKRFSEGLRINLLYLNQGNKCIGFIEYIPGEYAWRGVDVKGYMFIHCIWVSPNKYKNQGYGSLLIKHCIEDATKEGKQGVAVVASEGAFMAGPDLFLKNGFQSVSKAPPSFHLMMRPLKKGSLPKFNDWGKQLKKVQGLNILYANQCPWVARSIKGLEEIAEQNGLKVKVTEFKNAKEVQNGPSVCGTFNLIYNGNLLADHYISNTRFLNIIKKALKNN